jgi:hypothetical protein
VPARFIGRKLRVLLRANEVLAFDGRQVVARHPRINRKFDYRDDLDHFLEILLGKPGALAGSTALAQARADGCFTAVHEQFWEAAKVVHGQAEGTRVLIEVLLLHRHRPADAVIAAMRVALQIGSTSPELVAIEARKAAGGLHHPADLPTPEALPSPHIGPVDRDRDPEDDRPDEEDWPIAEVIELRTRLPLPPDRRPLPSVDEYDQLLRTRPQSRRCKETA